MGAIFKAFTGGGKPKQDTRALEESRRLQAQQRADLERREKEQKDKADSRRRFLAALQGRGGRSSATAFQGTTSAGREVIG